MNCSASGALSRAGHQTLPLDLAELTSPDSLTFTPTSDDELYIKYLYTTLSWAPLILASL